MIHLKIALETSQVIELIDLSELLCDYFFINGLGVKYGALEKLSVLEILLGDEHIIDRHQYFLRRTIFLRKSLSQPHRLVGSLTLNFGLAMSHHATNN